MAVKQRLFIISDIHIDYSENRDLLLSLSDWDYRADTLVIAGDVTDNLELLASFLTAMVAKFAAVVFVPGNHELWLKRDAFKDSIEKFSAILALCNSLGVKTQPYQITGKKAVTVVPLFSWYHTKDHPQESLYMEKQNVEDKTHEMWSDFFVTQWPDNVGADIGNYFLNLNQPYLQQEYSAPVVSVSHFLPRQELMLSTAEERKASNLTFKDLHPEFNFSHVAGSKGIDRQIRQLGSTVHVYGHQHRNRLRKIDGVIYLSHCMGYPKERRLGLVAETCAHPLEIWNDQDGFVLEVE